MPGEYDELVARDAAVTRVLERRASALDAQATEEVDISTIAGRVLAEDIIADTDSPAVSHATMDGFAFDATDAYPLQVIETEIFPEDEPPAITAGQAVRIATGAPLPDGANAVLKREEARVEDGQLWGAEIEPGTYTYERGSNLARGETVFEAGERLSPKDAILLRDLGAESVDVYTPFSVGVLATGTEIHEGRSKDLDSPMLAGLVEAWGHSAAYAGSVPDEYDVVLDRVRTLAGEHDVVLTTGGTSVGKKDYAVRVLAELGIVDFHGVLIRPGKPIAVGALPEQDTTVFAIPGKPVGAHTITVLIARPFFTGRTELAKTDASLARSVDVPTPGFEYAVPVTLADGEAFPLGHVDSPLQVYRDEFDPSVLSSSTRATRADGFFITGSGVKQGESVRVIPYSVVE